MDFQDPARGGHTYRGSGRANHNNHRGQRNRGGTSGRGGNSSRGGYDNGNQGFLVNQPSNGGGDQQRRGNRRRPYNASGRGFGGSGRPGVGIQVAGSNSADSSSGDEGNDAPKKIYKKQERKFEGPVFGFKRLYKFLDTSSEEVLVSVNKNKEDWRLLLEEENLTGEKLVLVIELLGEKICADVPVLLQLQSGILAGCCNKAFVKKLEDAVPKLYYGTFITRRPGNRANDMPVDSMPSKVVLNLYHFCEFVLKTMPNTAADCFTTLFVAILGTLIPATIQGSSAYDACLSDLFNKFKDLNGQLIDVIAREKKKEEVDRRRKTLGFNEEDLAEFDEETPPDSIKDISTIPTVAELLMESRPFLRPNKSSGAYKDANHYLDVQFRLLREDFVRPLRDGIRVFLKNKHEYVTRKRRMPLGTMRVYPEVRILRVCKERETVTYKLQLCNLPNQKKIKWEKSKRLLVGNLLLLTTLSNCFKTTYFAVVFNRNVAELEKGVVTVVWEGPPPAYDEDEEYLMFESEVYLEAYRHTLDTLKKLELDNFTMKKFIVDACSSVEAPKYLRNASKLLNVKLPSGEERYFSPLVTEQWPTAEEFRLNENQYDAFRGAISKEFSIVQGPPGTGKTFLGLKVATVLLSNSELWKSVEGNPITVVCYTNHALDQFLEGIVEHFQKEDVPAEIIRIGGRCKSEILSKYSLREVRNRNRRKLPGQYWAAESRAKHQVYELEDQRASGMTEITGLKDIRGIVNFEKLSVWNIIQPHYPKKLWSCFQNPAWLGIGDAQMNKRDVCETRITNDWFDVRSHPRSQKGRNQNPVTQQRVERNPLGQQTQDMVDEDEDDEDYDLDELLENRLVDDILLEAETSLQNSNMGRHLSYLPDCSVFLCEKSIKNINRELQERTKGQASAPTNQLRQQMADKLQPLENRKKLLNEICRLHKEQLLDLPDITDLLAEIRGAVGTVHYDRLKMSEKWALYFAIVERARVLTAETVAELEMQLSNAQKELRSIIQWGDGLILRDCKVVGLTTTGAAKYNSLLQMMGSKIVIVEEAAEVFEAHTVTCITDKCEQLILIGDHRQLRPSPTVYDLAKQFHLDLSLFERMINNNLHCYPLKIQHRMRPDISNLVVGSIYEELINHESVKNYPDVKGTTKNVFFLKHSQKETAEKDSLSKSNVHEAKFIANLCRYLRLQGYEANQITVLTMYTGQMFLLKKEISTNQTCRGIRITCVDNFQGEENDIILLSLVRSNDSGKIGFLSIDNRICVSLSRAKHGLYVIGNLDVMVDKSKTWRTIVHKLEERDFIGEGLELQCQIHGTRNFVRCDKDFNKVPEGGCELPCDTVLSCTHKCIRVCHVVDREHKEYRCRFPCIKYCENATHPCQGKCFEPCPPCKVMVEKTLNCELQHKMILACFRKVDGIPCMEQVEKQLLCSHKHILACHVDIEEYVCHEKVLKQLPCNPEHKKLLECHQDPAEVRCKAKVVKSLQPNCEHSQEVECWILPEHVTCKELVPKTFQQCGHKVDVKCCERHKPLTCKSGCTTRLPCGHQCVKVCHANEDPEHRLYECRKDCSRECSEGHRCKVRHPCHKPCPPCKEIVMRTLPCNHEKKLECHVDTEEYECMEECERILPEPYCRHKCGNLCYQPCGPCLVQVKKRAPCSHAQTVRCSEPATKENCTELVLPKRAPICGHLEGRVPCKFDTTLSSPEDLAKHCHQPCDFNFNPASGGCGHSCSGNCSSCLQGRIHMKCQEKCGRQLICGHVCEVPCSKVCPPCQKPCLMKCEHSDCKRKCGEPCTACMEKCTWSCPHAKCTKLCGEICNREPCNEPCPKKLRCDHPCVGFCGEPCPPLCRICDKERLTEFFLLGNEEDDNSRFVFLEDCRHSIEVEGLERWLLASGGGQIAAKQCPRCKTTIRNCRRFGNLIKQHYKDVVTVKIKSFGNKANSERMRDKWISIMSNNDEMGRVFSVLQEQLRGLLVDEVRGRNNSTTVIRKTIDEFTMRSIDFIANSVFKTAKELLNLKQQAKLASPHYEKVVNIYRRTFKSMLERQPLSRQETFDFNEELDRTDYFRQLMMRRCLSTCNPSNVRAYTFYAKAKNIVTSVLPFTNARKDIFKAVVTELDELLKSGLGISDRERQEILQAMGMGQGHWFKCPNGHIYVITECGGAMQEGRCNECGERIGGGSHQLRRDNQLAGEMDGATNAAWPTALL